MSDWYEQNVEAGIRDVVRLLRNNGFNTTCSCHHDMEVMLDPSIDGDLKRLHDLLFNNGFRNYSIQFNMNVSDGHTVDTWVSVRITDREFVPRETNDSR